MAYKVRVLLDSISHDQLVFDPILHDLSHPVTQDLSEVTAHGLNRAFQDSQVAEDFSQVSIVKFEGVQFSTLPVSAKEVVSC